MTENEIARFPRHAAGKRHGKPTIDEILGEATTPDEALRLLMSDHPEATVDDLGNAVERHPGRCQLKLGQRAKPAATMGRIPEVLERDGELTDETSLTESLARLAAAGDEQAQLLLEQLGGPEARLKAAILDLAIDHDPLWERLPDGRFRPLPGAAHKTPEALTAAFVEVQGARLLELLPEDLVGAFGRWIVEQEVEVELERRVAAGELVRAVDADGEVVYRSVNPTPEHPEVAAP